MSKERTKKQVSEEVEALKACKAWAPRRDVFGTDNHRKIDLQIEELTFGIDDTNEEWDDLSDEEQSAIREARNWREGEDDESPSSGWDIFKKKK